MSCVSPLSATLFPGGRSSGPDTAFVSKLGHAQVCLQRCRMKNKCSVSDSLVVVFFFFNSFTTKQTSRFNFYFYFCSSRFCATYPAHGAVNGEGRANH